VHFCSLLLATVTILRITVLLWQVVELDPVLIDVARRHFGLVKDERQVCHCGNALEDCSLLSLYCTTVLLSQVVELDPVLIEVARRHFSFEEDERLVCHCGDALDYVRRLAQQADAWGDAWSAGTDTGSDVTPVPPAGTGTESDVTPRTRAAGGGLEEKGGRGEGKGVRVPAGGTGVTSLQ